MKIGVKYCGGCNPRYDRVGLVRELESAFGEHRFAPARGGEDLILVICGCRAACADHRGLTGRYGKWIVTGEEERERLTARLRVLTDLPPAGK